MKLNKMLALALSGVMAVSMLAGCSGAPSNGEEGQEQPPVSSSVATVMGTYMSKYEFTSSSEQAGYLAQAVKAFTYEDVKAANSNAPGALGGTTAGNVGKDAYNVLKNIMRGEAGLKDNLTNAAFTPVKGEANSLTFLFEVEANKMNENSVLYLIAQELNKISATDVVGSTDKYNADYTGDVCIEKVEKSDANGKNAESAYVVLVTLTQTVSDSKVSVANSSAT